MERKKYTARQRVSSACLKCRSLKRKCSGERPVCSHCKGYNFECKYSDVYRGKRVASEEDSAHIDGLYAFLKRIQSRLDIDDQHELDGYLRHFPDHESSIATDGLELPPLKIRPSGILDRSSDLAFVKFVNNKAETNNQNITYFLDDQEIAKPQFQSVDDLFRYPTKEEADKLLDAYFSTLHIAYPFLCERWTRETLDKVYDETQVWSDLDRQTLSMFNFLFALGSYWCNWPYDDHCMYFARGRQLFFDIFKNSTLQVVQCQMLACFYLLIINKPARSWNVLGLVIRSCQNLGLITEAETATPVEVEMNRRMWYSAFVLEHLIALQLGRQPNIRDEDFMVSLPQEVSDWRYRDDGTIDEKPHERDAVMPYFNALVAFSRIIGLAQRELFFLNKPSMTWERTYSVIADIDRKLTDWKSSLIKDLDFEHPSSFDTMTTLRRQRNFFAMKYHNLRSIIHRPYVTLAITRSDVESNRAQQDICLDEARQTIRLLDHIESERTLQWDFPLWQLIPCLMSAATILVVGHKLIQNDISRAKGIADDIDICLAIFDSLRKNNAAQKCANLIRNLMTLHVREFAPTAPVTRDTSPLEGYDQSYALDLDFLTSLDQTELDIGMGNAMFDWGENNYFGYGEMK